jgi:hypothetical protein
MHSCPGGSIISTTELANATAAPRQEMMNTIKQWDAHALLTGERFGTVKAPSGFQQNQIFKQIAG